MSNCLSQYPFFAFRKINEPLQPNIPKKQRLGIGNVPKGEVIWLTRSTPKTREEWNNKPVVQDCVLIGYFIKHIETFPRRKCPGAILFIRNKDAFAAFKEMYGVNDLIDWDKVKRDWGGLELRAAYLPNWLPYRVVIWDNDVLEAINTCPDTLRTTEDKPIFIVYTIPGCPYSKDIVSTLSTLKIPHLRYSVKDHEKDYYKDKHGWETFPHVFLVGKDSNLHLIGGNDEFHKFLRSIAK